MDIALDEEAVAGKVQNEADDHAYHACHRQARSEPPLVVPPGMLFGGTEDLGRAAQVLLIALHPFQLASLRLHLALKQLALTSLVGKVLLQLEQLALERLRSRELISCAGLVALGRLG